MYWLVLGMSVPDVSGVAIANLEIETLQHKMPTFHGDTIYAETKVLDASESQSKPDRGIVTVETRGFNQRGEEVCYFRRRVMVPKRAAAKPRAAAVRPRPSSRPVTGRVARAAVSVRDGDARSAVTDVAADPAPFVGRLRLGRPMSVDAVVGLNKSSTSARS